MFNLRCFCITLPEYPERREKARKHFHERQVPVQFFDGIHAEKFGLKTCYPYELDHPGTGFNMGFKCVGIFLSHWCLWSALNLLWDDAFVVLEDDALFPMDWHEKLSKALTDTPKDADILYIGSCCCKDKPTTHIAGDIHEVKYPLCSHGFVIWKKALPILLETQRKVYAPLDIALVLHSLPKLRTYTMVPRLLDQDNTIISP